MSDTITIPAIDRNGALYPIEKMEAHREAVLHLAVSVFVFWADRLLIQKRAEGKYHCGGLWANTCCTHPNWGEDLETAAVRRLREELGLGVPNLEHRSVIDYRAAVGEGLWECERVHVFRYRAETPPRFEPAPDEVSETRWATLAEVREELRASPERFAPWFRIYVSRWSELNLEDATSDRPLRSAQSM